VRWETEQSFDSKLCQEYSYQKLSESDNRFSSSSQKCRGCFFWDTVYNEMFLIFCLLSSLYKYMKSTTGGFFFVNEQNLLNFSASG